MAGSRINNNNLKHAFQCFLEVSPPYGDTGKPGIKRCYPENYNEKEKEKIPEFVFPCTFSVTSVELFSFALTNMKGELTFGFCRHAPRASSALCVLSSLPWHEFFYKMLNICAWIMSSAEDMEAGLLNNFLQGIYNSKLPLPGQEFRLEYSNDGKVFSSPTPDPTRLPSIPENRNLMEYFNFVDTTNMITVFFSMLNERRVVVTSRKLSCLSACVQAANSLLYPFSWQHPFIPVLPASMLDFLTAPMPFLIGVPDVMLKRKPAHEIKDVVILDVDNKTVRNPFEEVDALPHEVVSNLKKSLKSPDKMGDHVARSFLQAMVHLIGGYRDALRYRQGEKITFDEEAFVHSRSTSLQPYLKKLLEIQMFQTFKDERLALLNSGKGYSDEFELECVAFQEKSNKKFTPFESVKKDGGALIKKVKNKTNPVVKDAVKNVLDSGKQARERVRDGGKAAKSKARATIQEVRSKFRDGGHEQFRHGGGDDAAGGYNSSSATHSAPSSPSQSRRSSLAGVSGMLVTNNNSYQTLNNSGGHGSSHQMPLRQNTDLGFAPVLKYERFDPVTSSSSGGVHRRSSLSPGGAAEHLSPVDSEDFMQEIDKVFNAQKPSAVLYSSTSQLTQEVSSRKASVGDLINLGGETSANTTEESVEFDPLALRRPGGRSSQVDATCTMDRSNHRKLSRTDASSAAGQHPPIMKSGGSLMNINTSSSFLYPSSGAGAPPTTADTAGVLRNHSSGKYQNYVPPGGTAHQAQFKNFMDSMKDGGPVISATTDRKKNSSEDLLKDYGLHELNSLYLGLGGGPHHHSQLNVSSGQVPSSVDSRRSFSPEARSSYAAPPPPARTALLPDSSYTSNSFSSSSTHNRHNGFHHQPHHSSSLYGSAMHSAAVSSSGPAHMQQSVFMHQYNNGSGLERMRTSVSPPTSSSMSGSHVGGAAPTPPPRSSAMSGGPPSSRSTYGSVGHSSYGGTGGLSSSSSVFSSAGGLQVSSSKGGNTSFLFNNTPPVMTSAAFNHHSTVDASMLPVNQRLQVSDQPRSASAAAADKSSRNGYGGSSSSNNNNHFLSELDPLCNNAGGNNSKPVLERTNVTPNHVVGTATSSIPPPVAVGSGGLSRQAPAIPPRSKEVKKKQWEKFD